MCGLVSMGVLLAPLSSVGGGMEDFYNALGGTSNVTGGGAYKAQTQNIITGGSLFMRAPVKTTQLMSFQPPSIKAGCGGIDLYAGSFSFINKDAFISMVRNIASNAAGHAFQLAIDAMSPMIGADLKHFQDILQKANSFNINSCQAGSALVDGAVSMFQNTRMQAAQNGGLATNEYGDASEAKSSLFGNPNAVTDTLKNMFSNPATKDMVPDGNIIWDALKNDPSLDDTTRLILMSMVGTVIFNSGITDGSEGSVTPVADTGITLESFLGDGSSQTSLTVLQCNDGYGVGQCKDVSVSPTPLKQTGFRQLVIQRLNSIKSNLENDQRGASSDPDFVNATSIPIYKLLAVSTALHGSDLGDTMISTYNELIVAEYASTYMRELLRDLEHALAMDKKGKISADQMTRFKTKIAQMRQDTIALMQKAYTNQIAANDLAEKVMYLERTLMTALPQNLAGNLEWANAAGSY